MNPSVHLLIVSRSKISPSSAYGRPTMACGDILFMHHSKRRGPDGQMRLDQVPLLYLLVLSWRTAKGCDECGERGQKRSSTPKAGAPRGHNVFLLSPRRRARPSRRRQSRRPSSLSAVTLPVWTVSDDSAGQSASGTTTRAIHSHVLTRH